MNEKIISLTSNAITHIKKNQSPQKNHFRLAVKKTGCSGLAYVPDMVAGGELNDVTWEQDGLTIYIAEDSVKYLQGTVVDFIDEGILQSKLIFQNPNADGLCGCGESFTIDEN